MCDTCGCSNPSAAARAEQTHARSHSAGHEHAHKLAHWQGDDQPHDHHHDHGHGHTHEHAAAHSYETVVVNQALLGANNRLAEQNRGAFRALDMLALNVVSSPGSGKTTLLQATLNGLRGRLRCGVIVGDLATGPRSIQLPRQPTGRGPSAPPSARTRPGTPGDQCLFARGAHPGSPRVSRNPPCMGSWH
jgi:hypothetical protein